MGVSSVNNISFREKYKSKNIKTLDRETVNTVLDSLNIAEDSVRTYNKKAFEADYFNTSILSFIISVPLITYLTDKTLKSKITNSYLRKLSLATLPIMTGAWLAVDYINSKNDANATKVALYQSLSTNLNDRKAFVALNEEELRQFESTKIYNDAQRMKFGTNINMFSSDYKQNFFKFEKELNTLKKTVKNKLEKKKTNDVNDVTLILNKLDSDSKVFEKKITQGFNLSMALINGAAILSVLMLNKLKKNRGNSSFINYVSFFLTLAPAVVMGKLSTSSMYQDVQNFSRYIAMQNIMSEQPGEPKSDLHSKKSIISTFMYYLKNRKHISQEMQRESYISKIKKIYKDNINITNENLQKAEFLKQDFHRATVEYADSKKIDKDSLSKNIVKDFLLNISAFPFTMFLYQAIIEYKKKSGNNLKTLAKGSGFLCAIPLINMLLTEYLYSKSKE